MDKSMTQLRSVTRNMGSHSATCHPTQVSAPRLNPSHAGRVLIYLPRRDGRLSWPFLLNTYCRSRKSNTQASYNLLATTENIYTGNPNSKSPFFLVNL